MTRKALILVEDSPSGAGRRFARAAQGFGVTPIVLSRDPGHISYLSADQVTGLQVNTLDLNAVIDACNKLRRAYEIVGATTASESFYATAASVCQHYGLPGPDPVAVENCRDKFLQRKTLTAAGVRTPAYRVATGADDARHAAREIGLPVVVKPATGTSSIGVKLCNTLDDVVHQTEFLLSGKHGLPPRKIVLIEQYAVGPFVTASTLGSEVAAVCGAEFSELPYFAMREFTFPAQLDDRDQERVADIAKRSVRALGLEWGPANTEIRLTATGPVVIEVNPRIVGAPEPELMRLAHGLDLFAETVKLFLGRPPELGRKRSHVAASRWLMVEQDGILEAIRGLDAARKVPGVVDAQVTVPAGTALHWRGDFRDVIGHVFVVSPTLSTTQAALREALDKIELRVRPTGEEGKARRKSAE